MAERRAKAEVTAGVIRELEQRRESAAPELAKQLRNRGRKRSVDSGKTIERTLRTSKVADAAAAKEIERPAARRRWRRASALPAVEPPPGYHVKWVRRDQSAQGDYQNLVRHMQEGWELARKVDFPGRSLPTHLLSNHGDILGNDNTVLMKIPEESALERKAYYDGRLTAQTRGVNQASGLAGAHHPAMPLVQDVNKTEVKFERMRRPRRAAPGQVAADD